MTIERTYFDFNATAPLCVEAREAMLRVMETVGNASSVHAEGRQARACLENAREKVAALVGVAPDCVTFTSGGTEANHLALSQAASRGATAILYAAIEHPSVSQAAQMAADAAGIPVSVIPVGENGVVSLTALEEMLATSGVRPLVSVMAANNETGIVQPVSEIAALVKDASGVFHTDAIQMVGKLPFDMGQAGADMVSLSAHKIGGPQGVGAFVLARDESVTARQTGGGQERGRRSGTENVSGIAGFGAAAEAATAALRSGEAMHLSNLRDRLEQQLIASGVDVSIFGRAVSRLPNTSCFSAQGLNAETLLMQLDLAGFAVSAGSACSSGKVTPSHVLAAMNVGTGLASGAIRVSLGQSSTEADIERFASVWIKAAQKTKKAAKGAPALVAAKG